MPINKVKLSCPEAPCPAVFGVAIVDQFRCMSYGRRSLRDNSGLLHKSGSDASKPGRTATDAIAGILCQTFVIINYDVDG